MLVGKLRIGRSRVRLTDVYTGRLWIEVLYKLVYHFKLVTDMGGVRDFVNDADSQHS